MSSFGQRGPAPPAPCAPNSCRSWHCGPLKPLTLEAVSRLGCEGRRAERSSPGTWRPLATVAGAPGSCWRGPGATVRHVPFPSFPDTRRRPRIRLCRTAGRLPSRLGPGLRPSGWPVISPACSPLPPGGLPEQDASLPAPLPCPRPARMPESAVAHARAPWDHLPSRVGLPPPGSAPPSPQGRAPALTACAQRRAPPLPAAVALRVRSSLRGRHPPPAWWSPPPPAPVGQVARAVAGFLGVASPALGRLRRGGGPVWRSEGPWASPQGAPRLVAAPASSPWPALFPEARATRRVSPRQPSP